MDAKFPLRRLLKLARHPPLRPGAQLPVFVATTGAPSAMVWARPRDLQRRRGCCLLRRPRRKSQPPPSSSRSPSAALPPLRRRVHMPEPSTAAASGLQRRTEVSPLTALPRGVLPPSGGRRQRKPRRRVDVLPTYLARLNILQDRRDPSSRARVRPSAPSAARRSPTRPRRRQPLLHPLLQATEDAARPCCIDCSQRPWPSFSGRVGHQQAGPAPPSSLPLQAERAKAHWLRFRSGVVRIRSTTSVCLLHGLVLLPSGISVAGADETSAGDATELKWELDEDLVRCVVSFHIDQ
ncbi:hypothetical protein VPH35_118123 [Triticum aestivum]